MRPLRIKSSSTPASSANFQGLQEMTDADIEQYISAVVTQKFADDTDGTGTGEINFDTANALSGTAIGTFYDNARTETIGDHPASGTVTVTTYYAKQVETAASGTLTTRPVGWDASLGGIKQFTDSEVESDLLDKIIDDMVGGSDYTVGTYKMSVSAPSGGTWTQRYTLTNTYGGSSGASSNTIGIWQQTAPVSAKDTNLYPVKVYDTTNLRGETQAEVEELVPLFRNRMISTGVGKYKLQSTTPTGGTWIKMGDAGGFSDTRQIVSPSDYTGNYTAAYSGDYSGTYVGPVNYTGAYVGTYVGPVNYTGTYSEIYTGAYTGPVNYAGAYTGFFAGAYVGPVSYSGSYTGSFAGAYSGTYTGPVAYAGAYSQAFAGAYAGVYSGPRTYAYTGSYAGSYILYYGGYVNSAWTGAYAGSYVGTYGPTNWTGYYTGSYTGYFTGTYSGPVNFTGSYTGAYNQAFTGTYVGPVSYTGTYSQAFTGTYVGPVSYAGTYSLAYAGTYTGPVSYAGSYSGTYVGPVSYTGAYTGTYESTFTGVYAGDTVQVGTETVSTVYLWLRTA